MDNTQELQNQTPKYFGDYEVVKSIGKGKFAVVYRAHKIGDDQPVALKRISVDMMNDKAREKCLKEVRLLQSLDHPNIIRYMDSFIIENDLIIVYEWAAAGDLKRQLRKAQERGVGFEERVIWKYFSQICSAMQHMHEKRIMHRDLKPANIFLTLDGTIKVGDLGLSRELSEHTIQAHSKVGTPLYMSPEVLKGDGYDFKSDIWSLGCLLYELAMLKSPFKSEGLNIYSLFEKISKGEYQPLPDTYSEELRNLCYEMISTDPSYRPDISSVCQIAARMRQITNDKAKGQKKIPSEVERPNSSNEIKPVTNDNTPRDVKPNIDTEKNSRPTSSITNEDQRPLEDKVNFTSKFLQKKNNSLESMPKNPTTKKDSSNENDNNEKESDSKDATPRKGVTLYDYFQKAPEENKAIEKNDSKVNNSNDNKSNDNNVPVGRTIYKPKSRENEVNLEEIPKPSVYRRSKPGSANTLSRQNSFSNNQKNRENEDDAPQSNRVQSAGISDLPSKTIEIYENSSSAFFVMESAYSKLIILGYPTDEPQTNTQYVTANNRSRGKLLPFHFAINLDSIPKIAGHDGNYKFAQFKRLIHVISWLCEKIGGKSGVVMKEIDLEFSSPITISKQILLAAQAAGELTGEAKSVSPTSLMPGYGYNVCLILSHFVDCALKSIQFKVKPINLISSESDVQQSLNGDIENEDSEEILEDHMSEQNKDDNNEEDFEYLASQNSNYSASFKGKFHTIENVVIDPILWQQETERVAPILKRNQYSFQSQSTSNDMWRSHVDMVRNYTNQVNNLNSDKSSTLLVESIDLLKNELKKELEKLKISEKLINSKDGLAEISSKFKELSMEITLIEEKMQNRNEIMLVSSSKLAELEENLDLLNIQLQSKTSGDGDSSGRPQFIRIKEAIQQIQKEIMDMHLTTAILNNELQNVRINQVKEEFKKRHRKSNKNKLDDSITLLEDN